MLVEHCLPFVVCYEGEPQDPPPVEFTEDQQKKLNDIIAKERRDAEAKAAKAIEAETRKLNEKHEAALQAALKNSQLSQEERDNLQEQLKAVQSQLTSKEEALKHEMKELEAKYKGEVENLSKKAAEYENKYRTTVVEQALRDAAVAGDAWSATQVVELLRPRTKFDGEKVTVVLDDVKENEDGKKVPYQSYLPPADAIARMKQLDSMYGNLFKSNVAGGIGGTGNADQDKPLNAASLKSMTPEEYAKRRVEILKTLK